MKRREGTALSVFLVGLVILSYWLFQHLQPLNRFVSYAAFVLASSQLIFLFNFFWSFFRGPKAAANPWKVNTLEWAAPTPIPHGNWGASTPDVYRWPYDYGVAGMTDDFVPQNVVSIEEKSV